MKEPKMIEQNSQGQGSLETYSKLTTKFQPAWKMDDLTPRELWCLTMRSRLYHAVKSCPWMYADQLNYTPAPIPIVTDVITIPVRNMFRKLYQKITGKKLLTDIEKFQRDADEAALRMWIRKAFWTQGPQKEEQPKKTKTISTKNKSDKKEKREEGKTVDAMWKTINHMNKEQLINLMSMIVKTKSIEDKDELFTIMYAREKLKREKRKICTHKLMQGLATLGAIATLAFGATHAETKAQKAAAAAGTAILATMAVGAHAHKQWWQEKFERTKALVQTRPDVRNRFQRIHEIIMNK